ncbi:MAG: DUF721 domain-containing protein [Phycisphaerales bacterium]|nr:DUF721 domain-containing protein [Phycisphaerales bacterium]
MKPRKSVPAASSSPPTRAVSVGHPLQSIERLWNHKRADHHDADHLGENLVSFFKQSVKKRQGKFTAIAGAWEKLVPEFLCDRCALESFYRGTLTVIVDSSAHLYELRQLLLAGVEDQLRLACRSSGLRKVTLKPGRWYEDRGNGRVLDFD